MKMVFAITVRFRKFSAKTKVIGEERGVMGLFDKEDTT